MRPDRAASPESLAPSRPAHSPIEMPNARVAPAAPRPADPAPPRGAEQKPPASRRTWLRPVLFMLLPLTLLVGGYEYAAGGAVMSTDNAYVSADKVGISTDVSGIVQKVEVAENQRVAAGDVLFRLDDLPFRLALDHAQAQIGIVHNDIEALRANYRDMQSQIRQAQSDVEYYDREYKRQQVLVGRQVSSEVAFDAARRNFQNAQQKLASLNQQLGAIAANLNGNPDAPIEQHPRYRDAVSQRDEAARQLDHAQVKAPFAGIVTNVPALAPGRYLQASTTAFYLVSSDQVWIDSNPKETQLTYVKPGQPVTVTVDTYPDAEWHGTVESISPAASQEFSLLPAQNTSGNWVKVVQRIPMRVRLDTADGALPPLRTGMSVEVEVDTGHRRGLPSFLSGLLGGGRTGTGTGKQSG